MPACCRGDVFIAFSECEAFDLHYLVCTMDKKIYLLISGICLIAYVVAYYFKI